VGKSEASADRHLRANNAMPTIKVLLAAEHMH
jgi:hypothetical protein